MITIYEINSLQKRMDIFTFTIQVSYTLIGERQIMFEKFLVP